MTKHVKPAAKEKQLLHLVFGGELEALDGVTFRDPSKLDIVGIFPDNDSALAAWKAIKLQERHVSLILSLIRSGCRMSRRVLIHPKAGEFRTDVCLQRVVIGIEQAIEMHDEIAHMRIVNGGVSFRLPRRERAVIVGENADDIEL